MMGNDDLLNTCQNHLDPLVIDDEGYKQDRGRNPVSAQFSFCLFSFWGKNRPIIIPPPPTCKPFADPRTAPGMYAPSQSNLFHFHAVLGKKDKK